MSKRQLLRGGSDAADPGVAIAELHRQIGGPDTGFVLFFCSPSYDRDDIAAAIAHYFSGIPVFGCTTAGEITPFGYIRDGLSGIAFPAGEFAVASTLFAPLNQFEIASAREQAHRLLSRQKALETELDGDGPEVGRSFGLLLVDGLSFREEQLVSAIGNTLNGVPIVGGSAGDGFKFRESFIFHDGRFVADAAILLLIQTRRRFSVFKTEHFVPTERKMVVTGADMERRRVFELNGEPAALEYARLVGLEGAPLSPQTFAAHPVVVRVGGEYHVRAIQRVNSDNSLSFFCAIDEGLVLTLARGVDILENLRNLFSRLEQEIGIPEAIIGYDCVLRNIELEQRRLKTAVSELFVAHKVVGFCTYGEQYMSMHVNQTFTGVAIGAP
ncbi:MAG: domain containing protein [Rhodospirillales bacterium]|nr:domain containing protein [Rhodospirillales bacterium]